MLALDTNAKGMECRKETMSIHQAHVQVLSNLSGISDAEKNVSSWCVIKIQGIQHYSFKFCLVLFEIII